MVERKTMPRSLDKTPSGESIEKVRKLLHKMDGNPKMRRAVAAAMKAMGLPAPMKQEDSRGNLKAKPQPATMPVNG